MAKTQLHFLKNHFLIRQARVRPRLFIAFFIGLLATLLTPSAWVSLDITRVLIGWNVAAGIYLILSGFMIASSTHEAIQRRACTQDDGQIAILVLVILAAVASLAAIIAELASVKHMDGLARYPHVGLAVATILSSWAFTHMMFAFHYAHDFYVSRSKGLNGGLEFPQELTPDYLDFCYLAYVIGTSGQTADVSFTNKPMRRVGMVHCVLAFLFNATVLALMINIAASFF